MIRIVIVNEHKYPLSVLMVYIFLCFISVCSNPVNPSGSKEIDDYLKIKGLVDKLSSIQAGKSKPFVQNLGFISVF